MVAALRVLQFNALTVRPHQGLRPWIGRKKIWRFHQQNGGLTYNNGGFINKKLA
jgi:hypothetical protein